MSIVTAVTPMSRTCAVWLRSVTTILFREERDVLYGRVCLWETRFNLIIRICRTHKEKHLPKRSLAEDPFVYRSVANMHDLLNDRRNSDTYKKNSF